jgi:hypothetical protein
MTFQKWLVINYNGLIGLSKRIDEQNGEEILHFTIDKFLQQEQKFLDDLDDSNKLKYISRTLKLQSKSETSQYYREVKKYTIITSDVTLPMVEEINEDILLKEAQLNFIEDQLNNMNWFSALLFRRWVETNYSAQVLADKLLIPLTTCQYHLRKVKNHIRKEWEKNKHLYI